MDRDLKGLQKSFNHVLIACILNIILGSIYASSGFLGAIVDREFTIFSILFIVIGGLLIYISCISIKDTLEDLYEFEDLLYESHLSRFDDLKAIQDEIDELVKKITSEKTDKCECRISNGNY